MTKHLFFLSKLLQITLNLEIIVLRKGCTDMIGQQIREERIRQGYTLTQLAAISGVSRSTISAIENGTMKASLLMQSRIGNALNITFVDDDYLKFVNDPEKKCLEYLLKKYQRKHLIDVDIDKEIIGDMENYILMKEELELAFIDFLECFIKNYRNEE